MKRLIKKESFEMLSSSKSMEATNDLIREIIELGDSEENLVSLFRTLNFTRFQLRMIVENSDITSEVGKNVSELLFVIDTEFELLRMRMQGVLPASQSKPAKKLHWRQVRQQTWSNYFTHLIPATASMMVKSV